MDEPLSVARRRLTLALGASACVALALLASCSEPTGLAPASRKIESAVRAKAPARALSGSISSVDEITMETRQWNGVPDAPTSAATAIGTFNGLTPGGSSYTNGPVALPNLGGVSNIEHVVPGIDPDLPDCPPWPAYWDTTYAGPGGARTNVATRYRAVVTAADPSVVAFRFAVDFSAGALIVDGGIVLQNGSLPGWPSRHWLQDLGTSEIDPTTGCYVLPYVPVLVNDDAVLEWTATLTRLAGSTTNTHVIELIAFEAGANGASAVGQYNAGSGWVDMVAVPQVRTVPVAKAGNGKGSVTSAPAGIACDTACAAGSASFTLGSTVTLTAVPATSSNFTGWTGPCTVSGTDPLKCTTTVSDVQAVTTAAFTLQVVALNVTRPTGGTITGPGGIDCGTACTGHFDWGTTVTLTATPAVGFVSPVWTGGVCSSNPTPGTCVVKMGPDKSVGASFTANVYSVTATTIDSITVETLNWLPGSGAITSVAGAIAVFNSLPRNVPGYTNEPVRVVSVSNNQALFTPATAGLYTNIATRSVFRLTLTDSSRISFRMSPDFGFGGAMLVDGVSVDQKWHDLCCEATWSDPTQFLQGTAIVLQAGAHVIEVLGFEGSNDTPASAEIDVGNGVWQPVVAKYALPAFALTVTTAAGGTVACATGNGAPGACAPTYPAGTQVALTATPTPNSGYTFAGWTGACSGASCVVRMQGPRTVAPTFTAPPQCSITVNAGAGGTAILSSGTQAGVCGRTVSVTATSGLGYAFANWSDGSLDNPHSVVVSTNLTLTASFRSLTAALVVAPPTGGTGTGTIACTLGGASVSCSSSFVWGTLVTLTATPDAGSVFTAWTGDPCSSTPSPNTCVVTLGPGKSVSATFTANTYLGTVSIDAITVETRHWAGTPFTQSGAGAMSAFDALDTTVPGYTNVPVRVLSVANNQALFTPASAGRYTDIATRTRFTVTLADSSRISFRMAPDFGAGGVMLVDNLQVSAIWGNIYDPTFTTPGSYLQGTALVLRAGTHFIEIVGFEGSNDEPAVAQIDVGGGAGWQNVVAAPLPTYSLTVTPVIGGTVTSAPGGISNCGSTGGTCSAPFVSGQQVTLTATPNAGFTFAAWSGACAGASCVVRMQGDRTVTPTFAAPQISVDAGDNQVATAGSAVANAPSVIVRDANGNVVAGLNVTFAAASGSGSVTGGAATTNAQGIATVGSWTLGAAIGLNTLTATATGIAASVTFSATGAVGLATQIAMNAGDGQTATVGSAVPIAPSVMVKDANGNPVLGVTVTFAVVSGGGSITGGTASSNALGIATVGSWILGTSIGPNSLRAASSGLAGSPVMFSATGTARPASQVLVNAGNNQTATAGSAVAIAPSVIVKDVNGNPVSGVTVTFAVATGGGSVTNPSQTTNASGIATVGSWTLGTAMGLNTLMATATGIAASVTFSAKGTAGAAKQIFVNLGDNQTATAGTAVAIAPSVIVKDANGNPVGGVAVTFAVGVGGGVATGLSPTTNASGIATVGSWTLGSTAGSNTLVATSAGLTGSPVTFNATALVGAPTQIARNGGSTTGTAGVAVAIPPSVIVKDAAGNPLSGVSVTFAVGAGGGSATGTTASTNALGVATVGSWVLGPTAGQNVMTATFTGRPSPSVTFTVTGTAGAARQISRNGGSTTGTAGTVVSIPPSVIVKDANGNAVSGVSVTFAVVLGGGTITGALQVSGANGIATVGSWTLGPAAGTNTLTATAPGLVGSPVTLTVTSTAAKFALSVSGGGTGNGSVSSNPAGILCSIVRGTAGNTGCSNNFAAGTTVTLAATPAAGFTFVGWSGATTCTGTGTCAVKVDAAKNVIATFRDATAPLLSCVASPNRLWPPNHKMVDIRVAVSLTDAGSGAGGFTLLSVTSDEPDDATDGSWWDDLWNGRRDNDRKQRRDDDRKGWWNDDDDEKGDGRTVNDIQGWRLGTAEVTGQLRAERSGRGDGRTYTLTYRGVDLAGNSTTARCTVIVPHDKNDK